MKALRYAVPVVLVLACLPGAYHALRAWGAEPAPQAEGASPQVAVAGRWGAGPGQFGLFKEEGYFGPTCFALDAGGQIYVGDRLNRRLQVFRPDGSFSRAIATYQRTRRSLDDICIRTDQRVYVIDGWLVYLWAPGAPELTQVEPQPPARGDGEPGRVYRLVAVLAGEGKEAGFYLEQPSRRPDGSRTTVLNQYDGQFRRQASVEAYDLCADLQGRRVCAILGPRDGQEDPWRPEVLVIDQATARRGTVKIKVPDAPVARQNLYLVDCDGEGRLYLLATKSAARLTEGSIQVYDDRGGFLATVRPRSCGSREVFLGSGSPRQVIRVDARGTIYVASATLKEGYRIEKYSWQER